MEVAKVNVESCEANGALRMLTEINAVHHALVDFTSGLMGLGLFGNDVELIDAVLTKMDGDAIQVDSYHRFGVLDEDGPDLNEMSISCGLLVGGSEFSSHVVIEADYDVAAGRLPLGKTLLLDERASSSSFYGALGKFQEYAKRVIDSPELLTGLTPVQGVE